jgi:predicted phage-related endonuclease
MDQYMRDPDLRAGSSFDFSIESGNGTGKGLLEIKNVDGLIFKNDWTEDESGNMQGPLHIEIQVQHELLVSEREYCYLAALIGGNRLVMVKRTRDEAVIQAIRERVAAFWQSIEANTPPQADYQADAEFIGKLFGYAEPGKVLNISEDTEMTAQAAEYKRLGDVEKDAKEKRDAIKAWFLTRIDDAEKCIGSGFSIDAGITGAGHREYDVAAFRRFKISWSKKK